MLGEIEKNMEQVLSSLVGKKVDVNCGASAIFRGEIESCENGVLRVRDEGGKDYFVAVDRVIAVSEVTDPASRPGFIA